MPDKSFEEQVRQEMHHLRIKPSDMVWEKVSASLQKERKRRWLIWLFFLLAGLSGASFWWSLQNSTPSQTHVTPQNGFSQNKQSTPAQENQTANRSAAKRTQTTMAEHLATNKPILSSTNTFVATIRHTNKPHRQTGSIEAADDITIGTKQAILASKNAGTTTIPATVLTPQNLKDLADTNPHPSKASTLAPEASNATLSASTLLLKMDASAKETVAEKITLTAEKADTNVVQVGKKPDSLTKSRRTWQWKLGLDIGSSGIRSSLRSLAGSNNSNAYYSPANGGTAAGGLLNGRPPIVRDGFSFGMALAAEKAFGHRKHTIGFSLGYDLYTTHTRLGRKYDSTLLFTNVNRTNEAGMYYTTGDTSNYTSYYHFIQSSFDYYLPIKWLKKMPVRWNLSIGLQALLASNGLHFDYAGNNGLLFKNRSLLRTFQWRIGTGLDVQLGKKQPVQLGVQIDYFLSNLSKQAGVNQHLFRPSIRTLIPLGKKK